MKNTSHFLKTIFAIPIVYCLFYACTSPVSKPESIKQLKAFDAETTQLFSRISQSETAKAIIALRQINKLPLPFSANNNDSSSEKRFDQGAYQGNYSYNKAFRLTDFSKNEKTEIVIRFPYRSEKDSKATFTLAEYSEEESAIGMIFPTKMKANLSVGKNLLASIDYSAKMKYQLPENAHFLCKFSGFELQVDLQTTFHQTHADIKLQYVLKEQNEVKLQGELASKTMISPLNTLTFSNLQIHAKAFPVNIYFESDDRFSENTNTSFVDHYNNHCYFYFTDSKGKELGKAYFTEVEGRDRINLGIRFNDGSTENLEDLLMLVKSILNLKIANPQQL